MLGTFSFSSDLALQGLGCSFKDSFSMPDPTGQMFSISFEREAQDSFPNKGKKESINSHLMFIEPWSKLCYNYVIKNFRFQWASHYFLVLT